MTTPISENSQPLDAISLQASLTVNDVRQSIAWYRDALGFLVDREFERGGRLQAASIRAGEVRLLLAQDDGTKGADRIKGVGFSLQITTAHDIDQLADRARRAGAKFETEPSDAFGVRVFRLRDPDGFLLVLSSPRERPA